MYVHDDIIVSHFQLLNSFYVDHLCSQKTLNMSEKYIIIHSWNKSDIVF